MAYYSIKYVGNGVKSEQNWANERKVDKKGWSERDEREWEREESEWVERVTFCHQKKEGKSRASNELLQ